MTSPSPTIAAPATAASRPAPRTPSPRPGFLDASKCIAYFTIEHRGAIPEGFRPGIGDWIMGCDVCQEVCPWNRFSKPGSVFKPVLPAALPLEELAALDDGEFARRFGHTPLSRARRRGIIRNALLAMGNSRDPRHRATLERYATDPDPVLREQATWSLNKIASVVAGRCGDPGHGPAVVRAVGKGRSAMKRGLWLVVAAAAGLCAPGPARAYPVTVRGGGADSFLPAEPKGRPTDDPKAYDAVVVGGGLAGMTAAVYLSDRGKTVLLLEKEETLGGVAAGGMLKSGVPFNRGVAYWTDATEEQSKILERIGLGGFQDRHAIPEPTDSYFWNGRLYLGLWEEETLRELPASFGLFKSELLHANTEQIIPNQPFEEWPNLELDALTAAEWIRRMPAAAAGRSDAPSREVYDRFRKDPGLRPEDPMADVVDLMDLYCRSALGADASKVSAAAFANFYISEITTRYTTPFGTGEAAGLVERILRQRAHLVTVRTSAAARRVRQDAGGVEVLYWSGGKPARARASYAVFAAPLRHAAAIVEGLAVSTRAQALAGLGFTHYGVHVVVTKGHPYRASFDTWTRAADYTEKDFPDVILGRWMDPAVRGYKGMRGFEKDPPDEQGILTIYHPYSHPGGIKPRDPAWERRHVERVARRAVERMIRLYGPLLEERWGTEISVRSVETSRWPYSIHVAPPGFFTRTARELRRPFGRVIFAGNNLGTPSFEEALFRGHCAANNILRRMDPAFAQEPWSKCPLE